MPPKIRKSKKMKRKNLDKARKIEENNLDDARNMKKKNSYEDVRSN